jgi:hypothetical protein
MYVPLDSIESLNLTATFSSTSHSEHAVGMVTTFANQIFLGLEWVIGNCYIFVYCTNRFRTLLKSIMIDFVLVPRTLTLFASRTKSGTRR